MTERTTNRVLWTLQGLLALLFLFGGVAKLAMPPDELAAQAHMPATLLRFVSVCELLGAIGLIVPELTGIRRGLTPLAGAGLIVIMIGATVTTAYTQSIAAALFPLTTGVLLAYVSYQRWTRLRLTYPLAPSPEDSWTTAGAKSSSR
jgi:general stress protein CsbA